MSFILNGTTIKGPTQIDEANSTLTAQQRPLQGNYTRDIFGSNKRVWTLTFDSVNPTAFTAINAIYVAYLANATAVTWQVTEANYTVAVTNVHVDIKSRRFKVRGSSYLSDFTLILTEA